jgi:3-oxoacyl-[acyl-carrier-protein] synthase-3
LSQSLINGFRVAGISTCLPPKTVANDTEAPRFGGDEVRKVVSMAGVKQRRVAEPDVTSADLCFEAATHLLKRLDWAPESITALIFVTQTPDYLMPSTSCVVHKWLGLSDACAAFDMGLGCSGYPYGLYLAASMLKAGGQGRILLLHGETPSHYASSDDPGATLLFSDAGSATALEVGTDHGAFCMHTDGSGHGDLIIRGGGFRERFPEKARDLSVRMDSAAIFAFTISRMPELVKETLGLAQCGVEDVDAFVLSQSNRFTMRHLAKKCGLPADRVPMTIEDVGNCGGPSIPVTITHRLADQPNGDGFSPRRLMLLGYGVGLSWASALVNLDAQCHLMHHDYRSQAKPQ